jgi:hypothetical protein
MKIRPSGEGTGPGLWVVLLQVSWAWNKGIIPFKNALTLLKKNILYSILRTQNTPTFCSNAPPKMGYLRCDSMGYFCYWYLSMEQELVQKKSSQWNNQFTIGVLCFYSIQNFINLIGTCLKIVLCSTYVHDETGTLLLVTLSPYYYHRVYFFHAITLAAAGSYRCHYHSTAQAQHKDLI